ncbi:hypothetical protein CAPTEDRAFT_200315 [Capitella teleta]|uniref:Uncharacterized protein n=1 Tax=Capitella teleta TaxID=283909 RepID=R7UTD0_CAPTE|nr:hypothetical protein CAPTEDRAFT_200315 [Capitella teleta]|eukprot:ELU09450.1 hypothetical protein CAPTEDRAFT_200315 [Capitella teleta]
MGTTFRISLLMTFLQTTQSHIQVSTFNPGNIPLNSAVDFQPVAQLENVQSKIQCVGACVLRGGCVAIVLTERCCKMYDQMASMTNWTPHNQSVYLELKGGKLITMQTSDTPELTSDNVESATSTILQSTQNYESTARNADLETTESVLETTDAPTTAQIMESTLETTATMTSESEKAFPAES